MARVTKQGVMTGREEAVSASEARGKWEGQPLSRVLQACLNEPVGPGPGIGDLANRLQANGGRGVDAKTWSQKLYGIIRGRILSDYLFESFVNHAGWAPDQVQRLIRADVRMQMRCRKRRLGTWPTSQFPHVACTIVTAGNIDQTIALPDYLSSEGIRPRTEIETFSAEPETCVPTLAQFDERTQALTRRHGSSFVFGFGGSGINVALTLRRLRDPLGVAVVAISGEVPRPSLSLGSDRAAPPLVTHADSLESEGVDIDLVLRSGRPAGRTASVVMQHGSDVRRVMVTFPGANTDFADLIGDRAWDVVDRLSASNAIHVTSLFDTYSPQLVADIVDYAKSRNDGLIVSFDPGDLWSRRDISIDAESVRRLLSLADLLFVNEDELNSLIDYYVSTAEGVTPALSGAAAQRPGGEDVRALTSRLMPEEEEKAELVRKVLMTSAGSAGGTLVVVKHRGAAVAYGADPHLASEIEPLTSEEILDDTGAGDAFAAGFLNLWIREADLLSALHSGLTTARVKLRHVGLAPAAALAFQESEPASDSGMRRSFAVARHTAAIRRQLSAHDGLSQRR